MHLRFGCNVKNATSWSQMNDGCSVCRPRENIVLNVCLKTTF